MIQDPDPYLDSRTTRKGNQPSNFNSSLLLTNKK